MGLGVFVETDGLVSAAGGFLIQTLPPSEETTIDQLIINIRKILSVTDVLREGKAPEDLLGLIFEGIPYKTLEKKNLSFRCTCISYRHRAGPHFAGVCRADDLLEEHGEAEVGCEFCRAAYHFDREELHN